MNRVVSAVLEDREKRVLEPRPGTDPGEQRLHEMLNRMYAEARNYREKFEPQWNENLKYLKGEHPTAQRPPGLAAIVDNQIWRIVQQSAALLTDTRPYIEVTSRVDSPEWQQINKTLRKLIEAVWFVNDVDRILVSVVFDLFVCGKAFMKCYWDPFKEWGMGDIAIARVNPRALYIDPHANSLEQAEYICYRVPVSLWELRRRFPIERASLVQPDAALSTYADRKETYKVLLPGMMKHKRETSAVPKVWLEEWWIRDPELLESGEPKYPAGRMITRAGGVILADMPNPYWDPWPGPWVEFTVNKLEDSVYGEPDISQLKTLQDAINVLTSLVVDNVRYMTNGIWIVDQDALSPEERKKLPATRPATVIVKRVGREVRRDTGVALPQQVIELLNTLKSDKLFISGLMDAGVGRAPRGITARGAIELLQMASQATIRLKAREIEAGLLYLGQRIVSRIFQFYTTQRVVDYLGPGGVGQITWNPDDLAPLVGREELPIVTDEDRRWLLRQFRIRMSPASSLAISKEREWAMELALYSAGLIDREAVLERIDYPNREIVLRRMQEREMMMAQAASASRGARGGASRNVTRRLLREIT